MSCDFFQANQKINCTWEFSKSVIFIIANTQQEREEKHTDKKILLS